MSASAPADQPIGTGTARPAATGVRRWPLLTFFAIAYGGSLLALVVIGPPSIHATAGVQRAPLVVFPVMVITVGLAGVALTAAAGGRAAARQLLRGVRRWHVRPGYYLALLIPPAGILATLLVLWVLVGPAFTPNRFPSGSPSG